MEFLKTAGVFVCTIGALLVTAGGIVASIAMAGDAAADDSSPALAIVVLVLAIVSASLLMLASRRLSGLKPREGPWP